MLTAPITNLHFQSRVLALHKNHLQELRGNNDRDSVAPIVPSLSSLDTSLGPGDTISSILGVISPWIDLCSPDPLVYNISRQVLELEIAFAAFCGLANVIVTGPRLHYGQLHGDGLMQYALAIQQALVLSNYLQIEIKLPMLDHTDADTYTPDTLGYRAREEFLGMREASKRKADLFGTWDAWNIIRTVCKYNTRLFVGKTTNDYFSILSELRFSTPIFPHFAPRAYNVMLDMMRTKVDNFLRYIPQIHFRLSLVLLSSSAKHSKYSAVNTALSSSCKYSVPMAFRTNPHPLF